MPSPGSSKGTAPSRTKQKRAARRATASAVSAAREIPPPSCPRYHRVPVPVPPLAPRVPKVDVIHGDRREDDYFWLRDKDDPRVTAYLEAENAYTAAVMQPTEAFQDALYREILGRIKEDDTTVPYRRGDYFYYSRTEKGKQYPIHCRRAARPDAPEEILLDLNALAEGHPFLALGAYVVSDDADRLAYTLDYTGFREYTLFVKNLATGELEPDRIEKVSTVAWSARPGVLLYVSEDAAKRPYRLWRHRLGTTSDDLISEEADELFRLHVSRSRSRGWLFAASRSFTSAGVRYVPAGDPAGAWRTVLEREKDHEYDVDHDVDVLDHRTPRGRDDRGRRRLRRPLRHPG